MAQRSQPPHMASRSSFARAVLGGWVALIVLIGSSVTALHFFTLPKQAPTSWAIAGQWTVVHGLASKCPCSNRVMEHLLSRGPFPGVHEQVPVVDATEVQLTALRARGFDVESVTSAQMEQRYGLTGAPVLVVRRPDSSLAYVGGHSATQSQESDDEHVLAALIAGTEVQPYPLFGCAVGKRLQRELDPLSLKYGE